MQTKACNGALARGDVSTVGGAPADGRGISPRLLGEALLSEVSFTATEELSVTFRDWGRSDAERLANASAPLSVGRRASDLFRPRPAGDLGRGGGLEVARFAAKAVPYLAACLSKALASATVTSGRVRRGRSARVHRMRNALVLFLSIRSALALAEERCLEISAEIERTVFPSTGTNSQSSETFKVRCTVGKTFWSIDDDFIRGLEDGWWFDGTNVYERCASTLDTPPDVVHRLRAMRVAALPLSKARGHVTLNVYPSADGVPPGHPGVNLPWLAFCSGRYLRNAGRLIPLPDGLLPYEPDAFGYADHTELFDDELGLPRRVSLFTSSALFRASVQRLTFRGNRNPEVWRGLWSKLPDGLLKFSYNVSRTTNVLGWHIPLAFEYTQNELKADGSWKPRYVGVGKVEAVRTVARRQPEVAKGVRQTVVDWRFADSTKAVNAITYRSDSPAASSTNDPNLRARFAELRKRAPLRAPLFRRRVAMVIGALFIVAASAPVCLLLISRKKRVIPR